MNTEQENELLRSVKTVSAWVSFFGICAVVGFTLTVISILVTSM